MSSTEEDVAEILISEIQSRPPLWNTKLPSYKNKNLRDRLYSEVGVILGISKEAVAARWKNKKDTYRRELKKLPVSRSGDGANSNSSSWPYFEMMSFLKDLITPASKYGNLSYSQQDDSAEVEEDLETQSNIDPTSPGPAFSSESSASQSVLRPPSATSSTTSKDLIFFKSLIPYMNKFQPIQKLKIRNKIQQIIIDEMSQNETVRPAAPENQPTPLHHSSYSESPSFPISSFSHFQY